ncbi:glycosyltransferase [Streptomyces mutabilis]|uniref:glycosyltransferase n=1 Tax=Streptomyces mutabilis TaxID=67332 RepID=UPI001783412A|nr:glycosyltransferase [Streptomyces mutabilis]GGQ21464.1 hypothetical protein GCM10010279_31610 [Streptomyces mutabilis]
MRGTDQGVPSATGAADVFLIVDQQLPSPDRDSGSLRLSRLIGELARLGPRVLFFPLNGRAEPRYKAVLGDLGAAVLADRRGQERFLREQGHRIGHALLCRPHPALELLGGIRDHAPDCLVVYDTVDVHFRRLGRQAGLAEERGRADRFKLRAQAETMRALELFLVGESDLTLVVSEDERDLLTSLVPGTDVRVLSNIHVPVAAPARPRNGARVLFVGHYRHTPNVDAAQWLAREIMPLVRREVPEAVLDLVGSSAPESVTGLAGGGVTVHGWVEDLAPVYARARVAVAPLRYGAGVKGKVGEAVEHDVPVVGTPVAFEGMGLEHDRHVLIGESPAELAAAVVRLLTDDALHTRLTRAATERVSARFSPERASAVLRDVLSVGRGSVACEASP